MDLGSRVERRAAGSAEEVAPDLLRREVAAACRLVASFGWDDLTATHISARTPGDEDRFLINPFGLLFEEVTASSVLEVDREGHAASGARVNLAGFVLHSAIHMGRDDARCVVHLHTTAGTAIGATKRGLLNLSPASMLLGPVAYHAWEGILINGDEAKTIVEELGSANAMILRNHGTLAVGRTMAEAFKRIYHLERACAIQVAAMAGGGELIEVTSEAASQTQEQNRTAFAGNTELAWDALLRRLERRDPSYME